MKVTKEFLKKHKACKNGLNWWILNCEGLSTENQIKKLLAHDFNWANWLMLRVLSLENVVKYAEYAVEYVNCETTPSAKFFAECATDCATDCATEYRKHNTIVLVEFSICNVINNVGHNIEFIKNKIINYGLKLYENEEENTK